MHSVYEVRSDRSGMTKVKPDRGRHHNESDLFRCRICGNEDRNKTFLTREMMFGLREQFKYFECAQCGCLQIARIPHDLSRYYQPEYFSLVPCTVYEEYRFKRYLKRLQAAHLLGRKNVMGKILTLLFGRPTFVEWLRQIPIEFDDAILDVGSGAGKLLLNLHQVGFSNLTGIDPYVEHDLYYDNGVCILKRSVTDVDQLYDFVMLHHTFEHIANPYETLHAIHRILKPERYLLIRIPVSCSYAWSTYKTDWVQLDAPRHLYLHTEKSMKILAEQTGFIINDIIYDSNALQFWGSEQYRKDIPYVDDQSYYMNPGKSMFTPLEMKDYESESRRLNAQRKGDQACFYLQKDV